MAYMRSTAYASNNDPIWLGDDHSRDHILPGGARINADAFTSEAGQTLTVGAAGAAAAATTVPLDAPLEEAIPAGAHLLFGGTYVTLSAPADLGDTELSTQALSAALAAGDAADYNPTGRMFIRAGTPVGRTTAEVEANAEFEPYAAGDDELYLLKNDLYDARQEPEVELVRPGSLLYSNFLPGWDALDAATQTAIREGYEVMISLE